jgi:transcriptional regulator with XRE-family HTH domain
MNFGAWVRQEREGLRMTQTECAARADMTLQQWNRIEKAAKRPQYHTIERIATGLNKPVAEVLSAVGYEPLGVPDAEYVAAFWRVPEEKRRFFTDAVRSMSEALSV